MYVSCFPQLSDRYNMSWLHCMLALTQKFPIKIKENLQKMISKLASTALLCCKGRVTGMRL
jgi:hypothetical protein